MQSYRNGVVGRFADLPRHGYQTIYAAQMTNGWVKVGCTSSLRTRFYLLANKMVRERGIDIADIHYGKGIQGFNHHRFAEHKLLKHLYGCAKPVPGYREFFDTVDFGVVRQLVDDVSAFAFRELADKSPA